MSAVQPGLTRPPRAPYAPHESTKHFRRQRISSVLLVPLSLFVIALAVGLVGRTPESILAVLASPWIAIPLGAFVLVGAWHMKLGMADIILDYVHGGLRTALLALALLAAVFVGLGGAAALWVLMTRTAGA